MKNTNKNTNKQFYNYFKIKFDRFNFKKEFNELEKYFASHFNFDDLTFSELFDFKNTKDFNSIKTFKNFIFLRTELFVEELEKNIRNDTTFFFDQKRKIKYYFFLIDEILKNDDEYNLYLKTKGE